MNIAPVLFFPLLTNVASLSSSDLSEIKYFCPFVNDVTLLSSLAVLETNYKQEFNCDFSLDFPYSIKKNAKYLDISDNVIKIKSEYLYVQNSILVDFISEKQ